MILSFIALVLLAAMRIAGARAIIAGLPSPYGEAVVSATGVLTAIAAAVFIDRLIRYFYWEGHLRRKRKRDTPALIEDIFTIALVVLGASIGLYFEEGVSFTGLMTASGATAIVLGIALQAVIQDLFSGLSINFDGSYAIGDWLTIYSDQFPDAVFGQVQGITWRTTFLRLDDGRRMIIPNRLVTSNPVMNHSRPAVPKRLSFEIILDNRFPSERAKSILLGEAFKTVRLPGLAKTPSPDVVVTKIGADEVFYEVRFYADPNEISPANARSLMGLALHQTILRHRLPGPVTNVEMTEAPGNYEFGEQEARDALARVPIFRDILDAAQLDALVTACQRRALPDATVFIGQGNEGNSMFVILEGAARVSLQAGDEMRDVAVLVGGDIVGEMSLLTGAPRTATVTTLTPTRVLEVTKDALEPLLEASPGLLGRFSTVLAMRQLALTEIAQREQRREAVEVDLMARMKVFFSRVFRQTP
jgi:small-conductance mechanosensitive channel/CRP-like cAMP-binding protein